MDEVECPYKARDRNGDSVFRYGSSSGLFCDNHECPFNTFRDGECYSIEGDGADVGICIRDGKVSNSELSRIPLNVLERVVIQAKP